VNYSGPDSGRSCFSQVVVCRCCHFRFHLSIPVDPAGLPFGSTALHIWRSKPRSEHFQLHDSISCHAVVERKERGRPIGAPDLHLDLHQACTGAGLALPGDGLVF